MKRLLSKDTLLFGLALLALAQVLVFGYRWSSGGEPEEGWLQVGDDVSEIEFRAPSGQPASIAGGEPTVMLIFDSQCSHCRSVSPSWQAWLRKTPPGLRVVGVSTEPLETAEAFVEEQGWGVDVWRVEGAAGSREHALMARTPWVFVLDGEGRILREGQGSRIAELTAGLSGNSAAAGAR